MFQCVIQYSYEYYMTLQQLLKIIMVAVKLFRGHGPYKASESNNYNIGEAACTELRPWLGDVPRIIPDRYAARAL